MPKKLSLIGKHFGRLKVISALPRKRFPCGSYYYRVLCLCECGVICEKRLGNIASGKTVSCGCYHRENHTRHGHSAGVGQSKTYVSWAAMWDRCTNPRSSAYLNYGGRGITVCERWRKFPTFLEDMGERPAGKTLDRKNVNGPYCPSNCKWSTFIEQMHNQRKNRHFTIRGVRGCLSELCRHFGVNVGTVSARLRRGWSEEIAFTRAPKFSVY